MNRRSFDGHSGMEFNKVDEGGSGEFQLILSLLKESSGEGWFIIHATSRTSYSYGLQPFEFLSSIGFHQFQGQCQFLAGTCFYRAIAEIPQRDALGDCIRQTHQIHRAFKVFADKIGELYTLRKQQDSILEEIGTKQGALLIFNEPVKIEIAPDSVPLWVEEAKFPQLQELENQKISLESKIMELSAYLPLLFASGETLVDAALKALRFLGLEAEKTEPGFTIDILARTKDGNCKFGIEVTGLSEAIKKENKRLTQLVEFERIKEHGEKTILIANTHNILPIAERENLESFTRPVIDFLRPFPILLMTSYDLYQMVKDLLNGSKSRNALIKLLYKTEGVLSYE